MMSGWPGKQGRQVRAVRGQPGQQRLGTHRRPLHGRLQGPGGGDSAGGGRVQRGQACRSGFASKAVPLKQSSLHIYCFIYSLTIIFSCAATL